MRTYAHLDASALASRTGQQTKLRYARSKGEIITELKSCNDLVNLGILKNDFIINIKSFSLHFCTENF